MPGMTSSLGPVGKHRSTFGVVALSIVTLGIYSLVWHNRVNHEVGNFDTRMHVIPGRSTLALTIPWALGWLISIVGAVRIVLAVLNVTLPFNPHFTVLQAYGLLAGGLVIPYLTLLLPFSATAWVMTLGACAHRRGPHRADDRRAAPADARGLLAALPRRRRSGADRERAAAPQPRLGGRQGDHAARASFVPSDPKLTTRARDLLTVVCRLRRPRLD